MSLSINFYAHPGQGSQGPAIRVEAQPHLGEYPPRGRSLKLADGKELRSCALRRRLPQIGCHFLDHDSKRIAEAYGCGEISSGALLKALEPWYQPCYRRPRQCIRRVIWRM